MSWAMMALFAVAALVAGIAASGMVFALGFHKRVSPDIWLLGTVPGLGTIYYLFAHRYLDISREALAAQASDNWTGRVINVLAVAMCVAALVRTFRTGIVSRQSIYLSLFAFIYYAVCNLLPMGFDDPRYYAHKIVYPLVSLVILLCPSDWSVEQSARLYARSASTVAIASCLMLVINHDSAVLKDYASIIPRFDGRLYGASIHPNVLGATCAFAILLMVSFKTQGFLERASLIAINAFVLALSQSKTSILALILGLALTGLFRFRPSQFRISPIYFIAVTALALAGAGYMSVASQQFGILSENQTIRDMSTLTGRTDIWRATLYVIMQHPIRGPGWGNFVNYMTSLHPTLIAIPHNLYLTTLVQAGVFGLLSLLLFLAVTAFQVARIAGSARAFGAAFLVMFCIRGISESFTFQDAFTAPTFWTLLMFLRLVSIAGRDAADPAPARHSEAGALAAGA